jgi:GT2 family glycosyltransferase
MIYIVIPVFNRLAFTRSCLDSLLKQTYRNFQVIVVDDGSTDGTSIFIREHYAHVIVLQGDGQLWWTGATNLGVKKALELSQHPNDYVLTLNNDLEVASDYLESLLAVALEWPQALVGSVSVNIDAPEEVHFCGTKWNAATAKYRPVPGKMLPYAVLKKTFSSLDTDLLPGRGILVPIVVYEQIGLYDGERFPHYMADEDFSLRAKDAGYALRIATGARVFNHISATGLQTKKKSWPYYKDVFMSIKSPSNFRNRWNWARRHGSVPPLYFLIDMLRILKSLVFSR